MELITKLFYLSAFIPLTLEIIAILHPIEVIKVQFIADKGLIKALSFKQTLFCLGHFYYFVWVFLGLFSSQGLWFLILGAISILSSVVGKYIKYSIGWEMFDGIISLTIILIIVFTKF